MKTLMLYESVHKGNTRKVAEAMAKALNANLVRAEEFPEPDNANAYDLVGVGSGIYAMRHHKNILNLLDRLPESHGKKAFIFSTSAKGEKGLEGYHKRTRKALEGKGFEVVGEFMCKGFTDWGPFRLIGGRNKGRPSQEDIGKAEEFAKGLRKK